MCIWLQCLTTELLRFCSCRCRVVYRLTYNLHLDITLKLCYLYNHNSNITDATSKKFYNSSNTSSKSNILQHFSFILQIPRRRLLHVITGITLPEQRPVVNRLLIKGYWQIVGKWFPLTLFIPESTRPLHAQQEVLLGSSPLPLL